MKFSAKRLKAIISLTRRPIRAFYSSMIVFGWKKFIVWVLCIALLGIRLMQSYFIKQKMVAYDCSNIE